MVGSHALVSLCRLFECAYHVLARDHSYQLVIGPDNREATALKAHHQLENSCQTCCRFDMHNLRNAVKHLSDGELDLMHAATLEEMKRRGRTPQGVETANHPDLTKIQSPPTEKRRHVDIAEVSLTRGQVNAVRAAFKAGITPSRIAREFGISQSNVRKALASDEPKR